MPKIGQLCCGVKVKKHSIKKGAIKKATIPKTSVVAGAGKATKAAQAASAAAKKVAVANAKAGRCNCPKKNKGVKTIKYPLL